MSGTSAAAQTVEAAPHQDEKDARAERHVEQATREENLVYDYLDEEPELHLRTYIALLAMFLQNLVQVFALQGAPAVVSSRKGSFCSRLFT